MSNKSVEYIRLYPGGVVGIKAARVMNCDADVDAFIEDMREFIKAGLRFRRQAVPATA